MRRLDKRRDSGLTTHMNTTSTDSRLGQYLSITGVMHTSKACATRGRNKGQLMTQDDVDYFTARGIDHKHCERCA